MTKLKLSSKMHLFIIISSVVIAIGLALALILQFVAGGAFNQGDNVRSYQSVTVTYKITDGTREEMATLAEEQMTGVQPYTVVYADNTITYKFSSNADANQLKAYVSAINGQFGDQSLSYANYGSVQAQGVFGKDLVLLTIVLASIIVAQFIYFILRFGVAAAICGFIADIHNLLVTFALLVITRIQVGTADPFPVIVLLMTAVICIVTFGAIRKASKKEENKLVSAKDLVDTQCASFVKLLGLMLAIVALGALLIALMTILGSLSLASLLMPALAVLVSCVSVYYGCAFFMPSIYAKLKRNTSRKVESSEQKN